MANQEQAPVAWVTGASAGIGEAIAMEFSRRGHRLVISARSVDKLKSVRNACLQVGAPDVLLLPLDLAYPETFESCVSKVLSSFGRIDTLVNNAGISQRSLAAETDLEIDRKLMEINYLGTVGLTKAVLPHFLSNKQGRFAVISSLVGKFGTPFRSSYAASKHALHGFFDSLRAEVHDEHITVTIICPGFINTDISKNALGADGKPTGEMDDAQANGMLPSKLAQKVVPAILSGRQEISVGGKERFAVLIKRLFPKMLSKIVRKAAVR